MKLNEDDKYVAEHDYKVRVVAGFIFGCLVALTGIVFLILTIIFSKWEMVYFPIIALVVGAILCLTCFPFKNKR